MGKQFRIAVVRINCRHWQNEEDIKPYRGMNEMMRTYVYQARSLGLDDDELAEDLAEKTAGQHAYQIQVRTFGPRESQSIYIDLK